MKKRTKKIALIAGGVALIVVFFNVLVKAIASDVNTLMFNQNPSAQLVSTQARQKENDKHQTCAPSEPKQNVRLMGEQQGPNGLYQIWFYDKDDWPYQEVSIAFGEACGIAYNEEVDDEITNRVPLNIARSLKLQLYEKVVEDFGGVEAYTDFMVGSFDAETLDGNHGHGASESTKLIPISSVDYWALQRVGIELPEDRLEVINIDDKWDYDYEPQDIPAVR